MRQNPRPGDLGKESKSHPLIDMQVGRASLVPPPSSYLCHHSEKLGLDFPLLPALPAAAYWRDLSGERRGPAWKQWLHCTALNLQGDSLMRQRSLTTSPKHERPLRLLLPNWTADCYQITWFPNGWRHWLPALLRLWTLIKQMITMRKIRRSGRKE